MPILVDSNVILDLVSQDPVWEPWSSVALEQHAGHGLLVNAIIYAELCAPARGTAEVDSLLVQLELEFAEITRHALFLASQAHLAYRRRGGTRISGLPDFFIGAHAEALGIPILTRDKGRYATYFPKVPLICP
ncbi:type II toxin-antitoxin system VapC family toxin [Luteolibacter sp. Populi]|uniref:type II toxin-antitoxin system VapC family toxin n=1 Tax=Luteolibacter sp. Populi TaxID=3230487 RepID=UPI003467D07F